MPLNNFDVGQLTSGSTLPPTTEHRKPASVYMSDVQRFEISRFIEFFVLRGDKGVWLYGLCSELGMLKRGPKNEDCSEVSFYNLIRKMKNRLGITAKRKKTIDLFKRMHPYCKKSWIKKSLGLKEEQFIHLKKNNPLHRLPNNGQYTIAVNLDLDSPFIEKLQKTELSMDEVVVKALTEYFNKDERKY